MRNQVLGCKKYISLSNAHARGKPKEWRAIQRISTTIRRAEKVLERVREIASGYPYHLVYSSDTKWLLNSSETSVKERAEFVVQTNGILDPCGNKLLLKKYVHAERTTAGTRAGIVSTPDDISVKRTLMIKSKKVVWGSHFRKGDRKLPRVFQSESNQRPSAVNRGSFRIKSTDTKGA